MQKFSRTAVLGLAVLPMIGAMSLAFQEEGAKDRKEARQDRDRKEDSSSAREGREGRPENRGDASTADKKLAQCLLIDNQVEVALAQLAVDRAQDPEVKQFAQMVIADHTACIEKLQKFAGDAHQARSEGAETRERTDPADRKERTGARGEKAELVRERGERGDRSGGHGELDFLQIKAEIADECLKSATAALTEKESVEFDKAYIGMAAMSHMHMLDALKVITKYASEDFQTVLKEGAQTTQTHLDHAKKICKQLDGDTETASRPNTKTQN